MAIGEPTGAEEATPRLGTAARPLLEADLHRRDGQARLDEPPATALSGEHERGEQQSLQADAEQRRVRLVVVPSVRARRGRAGCAAARDASSGPRSPARRRRRTSPPSASAGRTSTRTDRLVGTGVREAADDARGRPRRRRPDRRAGCAQADPEAHLVPETTSSVGPDRVHVRDRHGAAGAQAELEGDKLAVRAAGRMREVAEALAGDPGSRSVLLGTIMTRPCSRTSSGRTRRSPAARGRARAGRRPPGPRCGRRGRP